MSDRLIIETERLRLTALTAEALEAWVEADCGGLRQETGAEFPEPPLAPPLFAEDLPVFLDRMREDADELGWWVWLVTSREDNRPCGVCGLGGRPNSRGMVTLGYSVYPEVEGRGIATEASRGLVAWALEQEGVAVIRALVPVWNAASEAVARKLGMQKTGLDGGVGVGEVIVYEIRRA